MSFSLPALPSTSGTIILTTGLGLSDQGTPLRLPALLLPGLSLLRNLLDEGIPARYVVYQATDFIIETNSLNPIKAQHCADQTTRYLHDFVGHFYPDIAPSVDFKTGANCRIEQKPLTMVENILQDMLPRPSNKEPAELNNVDAAFALIRAYGERHKGGKVFMRYAAANVLLNSGFADTYPLLNLSAFPQATVVPLGGQREEPFFTLTSAVATHTKCTHSISPMIVPTGKMPAYYPCPDGDLVLDTPDNSFVPPRRIKGDFEALKQIGATIEILGGFKFEVQL